MNKNDRILAINPGSTSTKIAVYKNGDVIFLKTIRHSVDELSKFNKIAEQYEFRRDIITKELKDADIKLTDKSCNGSWRLAKPIPAGVYRINDYEARASEGRYGACKQFRALLLTI